MTAARALWVAIQTLRRWVLFSRH